MRERRGIGSRVLEYLGLAKSRKGQRPQRRTPPRSFEPLEKRELLSVCTWTGSGADNKWSTAANWNVGHAPANNDQLVFAGSNRTSNQNDLTGRSFQSIEFKNNNFALSGNSITLTSGVTVDSGVTSTTIGLNVALSGTVSVNVVNTTLAVSGAVSGTGNLATNGDGTLTLSGTKSYSGNTNVNNGKLVLQNVTTAFASPAITTSAGATTEVSLASNWRIANNITLTGSGTLLKTGAGQWTLGNDNAWAAFTMTGGLIDVEAGAIADSSGNTFFSDNNASLKVASGAFAKINDNNWFVDALTGAGTVQLTSPANHTLHVGVNGGGGTFSGSILETSAANGHTLGVVKEGNGTETFTGTNSYSGDTSVNDGKLVLQNVTNAFDSPTIATAGGATTEIALASDWRIANDITLAGSGTLLKTGSGVWTLGNTNASATFTMTGGLIDVEAGTIADSSWNTFSGNNDASLKIAAGAVLSIATNNWHVNALTGGGTVEFAGAADHTLYLGVDGGGGTFSGSILETAAANGHTLAVVKQGNGTQTFSGPNSYSGNTTVNDGKLVLQNVTNAFDSPTITTAGGATTEISLASDWQIANDITLAGSGTLLKTGSGVWTLGNTNASATFTMTGGLIDVEAGSIADSSWNTFSGNNDASLKIAAGAVLSIATNNWHVNALTGGGTVEFAGAADHTLYLGVDGGGGTFSGSILETTAANGHTLAVVKQGSGTEVFSGTNTYDGPTTVSAGTLGVSGSITSPVTVADGATLTGAGTTGPVTVNGTAAPGVAGVDTLDTADLAFSATGHYEVDIDAAGADKLNVTGTVNLGSAYLDIASTRPDIADDVLVLIQNNGSDPVTGTFFGLPEGAEVAANGPTYLVTYWYNAESGQFGTGNDVALIEHRPATPGSLTAAAVSATQIDLAWTASPTTETGYRIERMTNTTPWTLLADVGAGVDTYSDTGLTEGTAYYYRTSATLGDYQSDTTEMASALTLPAAPTGLAVVFANGGQANLAWQDNSTVETGYAIDQLQSDGVTWQQILTVSPGSGSMSGSAPGAFDAATAYTFRVRAFEPDFSGDPVYSLASTATETTPGWPAAPSDLAATAVSDTQIDLAWTASAGTPDYYRIERSADGTTGWTQIGTSATAAYSDSSLTGGEGTDYYYRVCAAATGEGDSAYSDVTGATTLLATPTSVVATIVSGGEVDLTWTDNSAVETEYSIEQFDPATATWNEVQWAGANATSATLAGPFEPGGSYTLRVRAYDSDLDICSAPSNTAAVTTSAWPATPTALTTTVVSNSEIDLSWTDIATNEDGYTVEQTTDLVTWTLLTPTPLPADTVSYAVTGLSDGTFYAFRVHAVNTAGGSGYGFDVAATLPMAPTSLQAIVISGTEIDLSWTAAAYATGYTVWRRAEFSDTWELVDDTLPATQTTYAFTGLSAGGSFYAFGVSPTNSDGVSANAGTDCVGTLNLPPVVGTPAAAETTVTGTSTTLRDSATDDGGAADVSYSWSVVSAPENGGVYFDANDCNGAGSTTVNFYAAGDYQFQVTATDACGASMTSSVLDVAVHQTLSGVEVTPADAAVNQGATRQFVAATLDQFGNEMDAQPESFTWSLVDGAGMIDSEGLYTAPAADGLGTHTITAAYGGQIGSAAIAVKAGPADQPIVSVEFFGDEDKNVPVPSGANVLYLGFNDGHDWSNNIGSSDVQFEWKRNGVTIVTNSATVEATSNVFYAFAPVGTNGGTGYPDSPVSNVYKPIAVRVPAGATSVSYYADGDWTNDSNTSTYGPDGMPGVSRATEDAYRKAILHSSNISTGAHPLGGLVGFWYHEPRHLLELSVEDANFGSNIARAVDAVIPELTIPEDVETHTADIIAETTFTPSDVAGQIHLRITGPGGSPVIVDKVGTALVQTLDMYGQMDSEYDVIAWLDSNKNGNLDVGEESEQVAVHIVKPWTDLGTWTAGKAALVQANADGASLFDLANDITGTWGYGYLLPQVKVTKGMQLDVTRLIKEVEKRVRQAVVDAANATKYAGFRSGNDKVVPGYDITTMDEAHVNSVFTGATLGTPLLNCREMVAAEFARGVIVGVLQPGEFDVLGLRPGSLISPGFYLEAKIPDLSNVPNGDWVEISNHHDYSKTHEPGSMWGTENTIKVGVDQFYGWPEHHPKTEGEWKWILLKMYNYYDKKGWLNWPDYSPSVPWNINYDEVPGYEGTARFMDIAHLAQLVFELRAGLGVPGAP